MFLFFFFSPHLFLAAFTIFITRHSSFCCCRLFYVSNRECVPHKRFENLLNVYTRRLCTFRFSSFGMQRACRRTVKMFTIIHRRQEKKESILKQTHTQEFSMNIIMGKNLDRKRKERVRKKRKNRAGVFFFFFLVRWMKNGLLKFFFCRRLLLLLLS